jgi:hypothetical protein
MTYAPRPSEFVPFFEAPAAKKSAVKPAARRPGLLRRLFDAVVESRQRTAEREAVRYLARSGGRFTDAVERELTDHLIRGGWLR